MISPRRRRPTQVWPSSSLLLSVALSLALGATVAEGGIPLVATPQPQPVLTKGRPNRLHLADSSAQQMPVPANAHVDVIDAEEPTMLGLYSYQADAGFLTMCSSNVRLPVATEGATAQLEDAYLAHAKRPGQELLVEIQATATQRPAVDGRDEETVWYIEDFIAVHPTRACPSSDGAR